MQVRHLPIKRYALRNISTYGMIFAQFFFRTAMSVAIKFKIEGRIYNLMRQYV